MFSSTRTRVASIVCALICTPGIANGVTIAGASKPCTTVRTVNRTQMQVYKFDS